MSTTDLPPQASPADEPPPPGNSFERQPPQDLEAEQAVLGAMMLATKASARAIDEAELLLNGPTDFYRYAHQVIYGVVVDMYADSPNTSRIDPIRVIDELTHRGDIARVGGPGYVQSLVQAVPTAANIAYYAGIVREKAMLRGIIEAGMRMMQAAYAQLDDADQIVENATADVQALASGKREEQLQLSVADRWEGFCDELQAGEDPYALDTPWRDLNEIVELRPGQFITVGAATSGGKSLFGMNLAAHVALQRGKSALVVSMEMGGGELMSRLAASEGNIDLDNMIKRKPTEDDWDRIKRISDRLAAADHFILDDSSSTSLSKIRARMRWMAARGNPPAIVVVDYLQLMTPEDTKSSATRAQEVAEISRNLKKLAQDFHIPVVALGQFNRNSVGRRPVPSDFKESSSIEQDSNIIILLHRELAEDGSDTGPKAGVVEAIVAKNRNGASGRIVDLTFLGHKAKLASMGPH